VKYAWIDEQRKVYGLDEMCMVLDVSESGYRAWKRGGKPDRKRLTERSDARANPSYSQGTQGRVW